MDYNDKILKKILLLYLNVFKLFCAERLIEYNGYS